MDIIRLYRDFNVDHVTEGHKHCRPGYVNVECPYCTGNPGYHLSYNLDNDYFICWRCGWHPITPTIAKLINLNEREAYKIIRQYGLLVSRPISNPKVTVRMKAHRMPTGTGTMEKVHHTYLEKRGFDSTLLEREWNLMGTGPVSHLDHLDFRFRILIPIIWNQNEVSFTSRDITDRHPLRYISCPADREIEHHKNILYGKQDKWGSTGICVEGPTDVWRLGTSSFATFGIKYTPRQVRVISKIFQRVAVCYDDDTQAVVQANKLVADLRFRGVDAFRIPIVGDPGSMKQIEADYLVKQILTKTLK